MDCGLYDHLYKCQEGDEASTIKLLDKLSPMLIAGSHYLRYEDAYNDLVVYLLAEIKRLALHNLRNTTDAGIITYFRQVIRHGIIHLAIKHRRDDSWAVWLDRLAYYRLCLHNRVGLCYRYNFSY